MKENQCVVFLHGKFKEVLNKDACVKLERLILGDGLGARERERNKKDRQEKERELL